MPPIDKKPPEGGQGKKKSKSDYTTGMSVESAMQAVKDLGLTDEGEIYRFFKKHSDAAYNLANTNPENWIRLKPNKDYKPPILESQIKAYQDYQTKADEYKNVNASDVENLMKYLTGNKYAETKYRNSLPQSGQKIIDDAKKSGAKMQENEDGTYTLFDDITTFRDSDEGYKKGRIINPKAKYNRQGYQRGNDMVNVYSLAENPVYEGRVPTEEEMQAYKEGNINMIALDPKYKPYYASGFFDPEKQRGNDMTNLFYGSNTNPEDVQRFNEFKAMQEKLKPVYERKARLRKIMDKVKPIAKGVGIGAAIAGTGGLIAAYPAIAGSLTGAAWLASVLGRDKRGGNAFDPESSKRAANGGGF